jgi:membrane protein
VALFWRYFRRALAGTYNNGALGYSKGAAYSALLSFFPILTTTTAILVQMDAGAVSRKIVGFLFKVAPPGVEELIRYIMAEHGKRPTALPVAAAVLALWAASGVMISLMQGFQGAYLKPTRRGVVRQRLVALWLVLASILPVVGTSFLIMFGDRTERAILEFTGLLAAGSALQGGIRVVGAVLRYLAALGAMSLITALLYYFGPDVGRRRAIWPGAFVGTALWMIVTQAFAWYVRNISTYNVVYGSIGAVIALCVWMYLLSLAAMTGCEFNVAVDGRRAAR